jgi:hypothetical protein
MSSNSLYLHIGFGKCGSSALQHFLSEHPTLSSEGSKFEYIALADNGHLLRGRRLMRLARLHPGGYENSTTLISSLASKPKCGAALNEILAKGINIIMSHEYWAHQWNAFAKSGLLGNLARPVIVVAYVRPQVEWLNSAWWQWFYWGNQFTTPEDFVLSPRAGEMDWSANLQQWRTLPNVVRVIPRLLAADVVTDFLSQLGVCLPEGADEKNTVNTTLTLPMLTAIKKVAGLRGVHNSGVDFYLQRYAPILGKKPWAIPPNLASRIIERMTLSNERLMEMLDPESRQIMAEDPRWWSAVPFADRTVDDPAKHRLSEAESNTLINGILPALVRAEKQIFRLRRAAQLHPHRPKYPPHKAVTHSGIR